MCRVVLSPLLLPLPQTAGRDGGGRSLVLEAFFGWWTPGGLEIGVGDMVLRRCYGDAIDGYGAGRGGEGVSRTLFATRTLGQAHLTGVVCIRNYAHAWLWVSQAEPGIPRSHLVSVVCVGTKSIGLLLDKWKGRCRNLVIVLLIPTVTGCFVGLPSPLHTPFLTPSLPPASRSCPFCSVLSFLADWFKAGKGPDPKVASLDRGLDSYWQKANGDAAAGDKMEDTETPEAAAVAVAPVAGVDPEL